MKGKNIIRIFLITLILFFTTLYITQAFGYYEYTNHRTNKLTTEAALEFEHDIKEGKSIKSSDYIKKKNDYDNNLTKLGLGCSEIIGNVFNKIMTFLFNEINKAVN